MRSVEPVADPFCLDNAEELLTKKWRGFACNFGFVQETHVIPDDDSAGHVWDARCTCKPFVRAEDIGGTIITHNSWDGREFVQGGADVADPARMD